jgi:monoterpene epsilon-lactone hydrolase
VASEEMEAILAMAEGIAPMDAERIEDRRAATSAALVGPLAEGTVVEDRSLGGRPALWFYPEGMDARDDRTVLYLHGGVFEVGSPSDYQAFCSRLALRLSATVVALDYRLAPEHRFPSAVDDVLAAYRELIERVAPSKVAIIGDSAGGGLVVSCLIAARRADLLQPAAAVSLSAWADLTPEPDSRLRCAASDPFIKSEMLQRAADQYLVKADPRDPLASPAHASMDELADLAPMLLQAAGNEILADDSSILADRVIKAGGDVALEITGAAFHVWIMAGDAIPEARRAMDSLCQFVTGRWS